MTNQTTAQSVCHTRTKWAFLEHTATAKVAMKHWRKLSLFVVSNPKTTISKTPGLGVSHSFP
jgi:hypothetical protein